MLHEDYMRLALTLARAAKGQTAPNPIVGAVIVQGNQIVGFGAHLRAGGPHAEAHALQMADDRAKGATVYVTLEPCAHFGRTPPCADALIAAQVAHVFVAVQDPNPEVSGKGIARLRSAGISVQVGLLAEEAKEDNAPYLHYRQTGRPHVIWKSAVSLDGYIAPEKSGVDRYLTGEQARAKVHRLRTEVDGIAVGVGTILADDPLLTSRLADGTGRSPVRIVFDSRLRTPLEANILRDHSAATWLICGQQASDEIERTLTDIGANVLRVPGDNGRPSLEAALTVLGERGILSLLLEGGQTLASQFIRQRFVDMVWFFHAPLLLMHGVKVLAADDSGASVSLADCHVTQVGEDTLTVGRPVYRGEETGGEDCVHRVN